ncbi:MAG: thioredoxin family protein [Candidatus Berkelbacteria bacterium]|nr:thioredoxin family protein [Candidatus Berkelbacteria bacterium]
MKNVILPSLVVLLIVAVVVILGSTGSKKTTPQNSTSVSSYDENAKVMFFYSDLCSWCQKEKTVLDDLAKDGYQVKPMDVKAHPDYWEQYKIKGTPTFIAPDGNRLDGYTEKEPLKQFLDKYKQ